LPKEDSFQEEQKVDEEEKEPEPEEL